MRSLLYIIAVILVIGWALGEFAWHAGSIIDVLLVLAIVSLSVGEMYDLNVGTKYRL